MNIEILYFRLKTAAADLRLAGIGRGWYMLYLVVVGAKYKQLPIIMLFL